MRAVPLLPDGTSPRTSPGIAALGIPVVAGRGAGWAARGCGEPTTLDGGSDPRAFERPGFHEREQEGGAGAGQRTISVERAIGEDLEPVPGEALERFLDCGCGVDANDGALDVDGRAASVRVCMDTAGSSPDGGGERLGIPVEDEFARSLFEEEFLGIKMVTEGDMLTVVFPDRVREDAAGIPASLFLLPDPFLT